MLLRCLSQHSEEEVYETTPMPSSLHPTLQHLAETLGPSVTVTKEVVHGHPGGSLGERSVGLPQTLTLVLVCRSKSKGEQVRQELLREQDELLLSRAREGRKIPDGWRDGLRIELDTCDLSTPGGDNGLLALSSRLKRR